MNDQGQITTSGEIEFGPLTEDGEPMFSQATVQEGLFSTEAFEQQRGQTALETDEGLEFYDCACEHCDGSGALHGPSVLKVCHKCNGTGREFWSVPLETDETCVVCGLALEHHWLGSCPDVR